MSPTITPYKEIIKENVSWYDAMLCTNLKMAFSSFFSTLV